MEGFYIHERENPTSFLIGLEYRDEVYRAIATTLDPLFSSLRAYIYIYAHSIGIGEKRESGLKREEEQDGYARRRSKQ